MRFLAQNSSTGEMVGSAATGSFEERENCFPVLGPFYSLLMDIDIFFNPHVHKYKTSLHLAV